MQISCFRNFRSKKPESSTLEAIAEYIRTDRSLAQITALYRKDGSKTIKEESPLFAVLGVEPDRQCKNVGRLSGLAHAPGCIPFPPPRWQDGRTGRLFPTLPCTRAGTPGTNEFTVHTHV